MRIGIPNRFVPIATIAILGLTFCSCYAASAREPERATAQAVTSKPADMLDEFRRDAVLCDTEMNRGRSSEETTFAPQSDNLPLFPFSNAWPRVPTFHIVREFKKYRTVNREDLQDYVGDKEGGWLFSHPLDGGISCETEQSLLLQDGITAKGGVIASNYANVFVKGTMAGLINTQSYALVIVHGDVTGSIYCAEYAGIILRGQLTGKIDIHAGGAVYLLDGLGGLIHAGNDCRIYVAGRTTTADLKTHLMGKGSKVWLESSDMSPGTHQIGGAAVVVLGGTGTEHPASEASANTPNRSESPSHIPNQRAPLIPVSETPDVADVFCEDLHVGGDADKRYLLMSMAQPNAVPPPNGYHLLLVLPGGDGGPTFNPFVKRIVKNAVPPGYLVAQLVAPEWTPDQNKSIVWPLRKFPFPGAHFTTEEFIESAIAEIAAKHKIDRRYIFALGWSSGGPPVYSETLGSPSSVTGAFVAMSVFLQTNLPALTGAKGKAFFLYHSPDDFIRISQAEKARDELAANGAHTTLVTYPGGHGWTGPIYDDIHKGLLYLETNAAGTSSAPETPKASIAASNTPVTKSDNLLINADLEKNTGTFPDSWKPDAIVEGVSCIYDQSVGHDSTHSLCLRKTLNRFWPASQWSQTIPYRAGLKKLTVSAWVRTQDTTKAVLDVQFLGADGAFVPNKYRQWAAYIGPEKAGDPPLNHDWKLYSGTVEIPDGTAQIVIAPQIYGPGTVWFDDISATPVP